MILYVLGTVVVVLGGVAVLIFLALSSNRGASTQPQSQQPTQQQLQVDPDWKKWAKRIGWVFFALIILDLWRKFVFPSVPVEWKEWVPGFSWNTIEILAAIAGVVILWNKRRRKSIGNQCGGGVNNITPPSKKVVEKENHASRDTLLAVMFLFIGFFLVYMGRPYQDTIPVPAPGMIYVPIYGLLLAGSGSAFIAFLWSSFDKTDDSGIYFLVPLALAFVFMIYGIAHDWFVPIQVDPNLFVPGLFRNDPSMSLVSALVLAFIIYCIIAKGTKNDTAKVITIMMVLTLWFSQYPVFRAIVHKLF